MKAIVNVSRNWGIGYKGRLLISIPEDMRFFRSVTLGKTVIMGRKTLESFPGGRPLKGRVNIVLSSCPESIKAASPDASTSLIAVRTKEEALTAAGFVPGKPDPGGDIFVIGGASIYRLFLDDCDTCLVTCSDIDAPADSFFPDLGKEGGWRLYEKGKKMFYGDVSYSFDTWKKEP